MTTETLEEVESDEGSGAARLPERYRRRRAEAAVAAIHEEAERLKRREVQEAVGKLDARGDLGDVQRDALEVLADAIVEQLLAAPTWNLRHGADRSTVHTALHLFDLGSGAGGGPPPAVEPDPLEVDDGE